MKRLIEMNLEVDIANIKSKLQELSELDRVLSSQELCRRQSILLLLDEVTDHRCLSSELRCDNCKHFKLPMDRIVSNEVVVVLKFLNQCLNVDVYIMW